MARVRMAGAVGLKRAWCSYIQGTIIDKTLRPTEAAHSLKHIFAICSDTCLLSHCSMHSFYEQGPVLFMKSLLEVSLNHAVTFTSCNAIIDTPEDSWMV